MHPPTPQKEYCNLNFTPLLLVIVIGLHEKEFLTILAGPLAIRFTIIFVLEFDDPNTLAGFSLFVGQLDGKSCGKPFHDRKWKTHLHKEARNLPQKSLDSV